MLKKSHYVHGCDRGRNPNHYSQSYLIDTILVTNDLTKTNCKSCLKIIHKYHLKPKNLFTETPVFNVTASGYFKNSSKNEAGCHLSFQCPVCGKINTHGGVFGKIGAGDGHRCSHCRCWEKGYFIKEVSL